MLAAKIQNFVASIFVKMALEEHIGYIKGNQWIISLCLFIELSL